MSAVNGRQVCNVSEKKKLKQLNELVTDFRKENERFVDKVSLLQQKLNSNSMQSSMLTGIGKNEGIREKLESTTSYFTEEDDAVRDLAYAKMQNEDDILDDTDCFQ